MGNTGWCNDPVWRGHKAKYIRTDDNIWFRFDSPRMDGEFYIAESTPRHPLQDERICARLTTLVIEQRSLGVAAPKITEEMVKQAESNNDLSVEIRAQRLLRRIALEAKRIDAKIEILLESSFIHRLLAWAEVTTFGEIQYLVDYLIAKGWLYRNVDFNNLSVKITVAGYSQIEKSAAKVDSSQCFVAMWFDEETDNCYQNGIKPAIEQAGYEVMRIDHKEHSNKIDDEIIAEIRRSLFLVADFTHGEGGIRGGVYYEAGFAYGLGLPVIFTCRKDKIEELHFDTRQYNHIIWEAEELEQFRQDLYNRIRAVIGEGPNNDP